MLAAMAMDQLAGIVDDAVDVSSFPNAIDEGPAIGPRAPAVHSAPGTPPADSSALADALSYLRRYQQRPQFAGMPWQNSPLVCAALGARPRGYSALMPRMPGPVVPQLGVVHPMVPFMAVNRRAPVCRPASSQAAWAPVRPSKSTSLTDQGIDEELEGAHGIWRELVRGFGDSSKLFRQIADAGSPEEAASSFESAFYSKPASTLLKRACSLRLFTKWARARGRTPWPVSEATGFAYAESLRTEGAPATRLQSWREALGFAKAFAGLEGVDEVLESRRISGSALRCYATKRIQVKRQQLSVRMVTALEDVVCDSRADSRDRVFAGFALFCVFARLRVGDAARIRGGVKLDLHGGTGFVEASMLDHKRAAKVRRKVPLPVVAPVVGAAERPTPWGIAWARARSESQLLDDTFDQQPLAQSVLASGAWSGRRLTTSEAAQWLCELLRKHGFSMAELEHIGSHSLKATALSWMAKAGIHKSHRRLLGGHMKPGDRTMAEYSRDELAEPLRHLGQTLQWVRDRKFDPDSTRSGRWTGAAKKVPAPGIIEQRDGASDDSEEFDPLRVFSDLPSEGDLGAVPSEPSVESNSPKASASEDELEASDAEVEIDLLAWSPPCGQGLAEGGLLPPLPEGGLIRSGVKPFTIHALRQDVAATACGVTMSDRHTMIPGWPDAPWPRCQRCFRER